ncbi:MAG TPA: hypothetical protein VGM56_16045 [Byssovorax sp.]|jgi:hypothetical protein
MKIRRVTFLGIRGVPDGAHELGDARGVPRDLVLVVGGPATGKTRALEAIFAAKEGLAPYGPMLVGRPWIAGGDVLAKVALTFYLNEEEQAFANLMQTDVDAEVQLQQHRVAWDADDGLLAVLGRYEHERTGKFEYFPSRREIPRDGALGGLDGLEQRRLRPTKEPRKYAFVGRFLRELAAHTAEADVFAAKLAALSPTCRYARAALGEGLPACFTSRGGANVTLAELSHAELDAVLFAATACAIGLDHSIVLVDRPELHLAPGEAAAFLAGLRALGVDNQIFLATSSREVAAAAEGAAVIDVGAAPGGVAWLAGGAA